MKNKPESKNKKRIILAIEFVIMAVFFHYTFTDGFTKSLHETFGLKEGVGMSDKLFGIPDPKRLLIAIIVVVIVYTCIYIFNKKKK